MKKPRRFPSKPVADPLRWAIAAVLLAPTGAMANGIDPVAGPGGTPLLGEHNGVPVIDIVAPNGHGLSHNQFGDYNVGQNGAVLNNALQAGQSQLAGQLNGNAQFNGAAASIILNEVVGGHASLINGPQEIFGQAADYILANPNGIHVNGGRLINAPHSAFLVGTPELIEGRITGLNTFDAQGELDVAGAGLTSDGALDLIAPKINTSGQLQAPGALNLISGRNRVAPGTADLLETRQTGAEAGIDTSLLGGMRAGRIRVISTADGAGVRMASADFIAQGGIEVQSAGSLRVGSLDSKTRLAAEGDVTLNARDDLLINNTRVGSHHLSGEAGKNLRISPGSHSSERTDYPEDEIDTFLGIVTERRLVTRTTRKQEHDQSVFTAGGNIELKAGGNLDATGVDMRAEGHVGLDAGGDLSLLATQDRTEVNTHTYHRKHLWKSDSNGQTVSERAVATRVHGNTVSLRSGGTTTVRGSEVTSAGDMQVAARTLVVDSHGVTQGDAYREKAGDYLGGLVTKRHENRDGSETQHVGSHLDAGGTLRVNADEVRIVGSKVNGTEGAMLISDNGAVTLQSSHNLKRVDQDTSNGSLFGALGSSSSSNATSTHAIASEATSQSNLTVSAATDVNIKGAKVEAGGALAIAAKGDVNVVPERNTQGERSETTDRRFVASAGETQQAEDNKASSKQYEAKVGYQTATTSTAKTRETLQRPTLKGATVTLGAVGTTQLDSATVAATEGDAIITGAKVVLDSSSAKTDETRGTRTSGGGIGVTGGMDRSGSFSYGEHTGDTHVNETTTAERTGIASKGVTRLVAGDGQGEIINRGGQIIAGGNAELTARQVTNEAVHDTQRTATERLEYGGTAGINIETQFITRPIEKMIDGKDQSAFQKGVEEALMAPSLGIDVAGRHTGRTASENQSTAKVSHIEGATVSVNVDGHLADEGTHYKAREGQVNLVAGSHDAKAASSTRHIQVERLDVDGSLRVDTVTSADINGRAMASGSSLSQEKTFGTATPALIEGANGIGIQLGTDGRYEGTRLDAGQGHLEMKAGGNVTLAQANDTQHETTRTTDGFGWVRVGTGPAKARDIGGGGALNHDQQNIRASQAVTASLDGKAARIDAGGDVITEGARVGSTAKPLDRYEVIAGGNAHLNAAVDTRAATGQRLGGGLQASASHSPDSPGGGLGGHIDMGRTHERLRQENTSDLHARDIKVLAGGSDEVAVRFEGVNVVAHTLDLKAPHGGLALEGATTTESKNNLAITAGLGANSLRSGEPSTGASGVHARLRVKVDNLDSTAHMPSELTAGQVSLASGDDASLHGVRIKAERVTGHIDGDLRVSTPQDRVKGIEVNVDGRISREHNPQGLLNAATALSGPLGGNVRDNAGTQIQRLDPNTSPGLALDVVRTDRTTAARQTEVRGRDGIELTVEGTTRLEGALLKASQGKVNLGDGKLETVNLAGRDYRADVSLNGSNSPTELLSGVIGEVTASKSSQAQADEHFNAGLIRSGGHDRQQMLEAKIEQR